MKTTVPLNKILNYLSLVLLYLVHSISVNAQTYSTIANGAWNSAATWQGGIIPDATNIPAAAVINIKHVVTYPGGNIRNGGTINIANPMGVSPRLIVAGGINLQNDNGGKIYIIDGEYRQFRFVGGGETGVAQNGKFTNNGGYIKINNSFVEVAQDWTNQGSGIVNIMNSSLVMGGNYDMTNSAVDTLQYTSVSIGMQGTGNYTADGLRSYFQSARFQVASSAGIFTLKSGTANGNIEYITLKNHVTGTYSSKDISTGPGLVTTGLTLGAYCAASPANYIPNGKFSGTQTPNCSLNYFPAGLKGSTSTASFNFSTSPLLVSGTALQVGAIYKYEGVSPGVDAMLKVDSLIRGATITTIDDNAGGAGYMEGFQPHIKDGPATGESYAVFTIDFKISGTSVAHKMNTFGLTALDIDGNGSLKEFDQIDLGPGAKAAYNASPTNISLTQVGPGAYRAINTDGKTINGIDTVSKANMFTVTNANVSSFTLKLGTVKTNNSQTSRQFGIYMKGFVYPTLVTLPVKLEFFTATLENSFNKVDLKWATSFEKDVSHFSVEKSLDGQNFSQAGIVFAMGNSSEIVNYSLADKNINTTRPGIIYYRLRSIDVDGSAELSAVRMITIGSQNKQVPAILTYPNPVTNELYITIPTNWQGKNVTYELLDNNGRAIKGKVVAGANQTESINVANLARGFYLARVICNEESAQQKVIKR